MGIGTPQKGVRAQAEFYTLLAQAIGEPVVLIQTHPRGEGKIGTDAYEHAPPVDIVEVDIVLVDPALPDFQVPAVILGVAVGNQDTGWFPRFQNDHDCVGLGAPEIGIHEVIPAAFGSVQDRHTPLPGVLHDPIPELVCDIPQEMACHTLSVSIGVEEADHPLRLLEGRDQAVEQNAVKAPILESNTILMVLAKGVHGLLQGLWNTWKDKPWTPQHPSTCSRSAPATDN